MRGKKTSPETVYKIMAAWAINNNFAQTARDLNISESSVRKIVIENKNKPEFAELCGLKKKEFSEATTELINLALERIRNLLENEEAEIPLNQLTTAIGTLYDKRA